MKQISSATITSLADRASATGTALGSHGSETPESLRVAEWLAQRTPLDVDRAAVLRVSQHGVSLAVKAEYRFPKDERGNPLPTLTIIRGCDVQGDREGRQLAAEVIAKMQTPAPQRAIEGWLAELSVICAKRQDDEFCETLRLEAYASRLRAFPADVARHALLGRAWKFWPTWAELEQACKEMAAPRVAMAQALARPVSAGGFDEPAPRCTADAADRIMAEVWGTRDSAPPPRKPHWTDAIPAGMENDADAIRRAKINAGVADA